MCGGGGGVLRRWRAAVCAAVRMVLFRAAHQRAAIALRVTRWQRERIH